jgi:hypothetical protein
MRKLIITANLLAAFVIVIWGAQKFIVPEIAVAVYENKYKEMMFTCDHVMREHFIAKQMVLVSATEKTVRNLESSEIGLISCHDYDKFRKTLISWGVTKNRIAALGLQAIEEKATDVHKFVEIHEVRY